MTDGHACMDRLSDFKADLTVFIKKLLIKEKGNLYHVTIDAYYGTTLSLKKL